MGTFMSVFVYLVTIVVGVFALAIITLILVEIGIWILRWL